MTTAAVLIGVLVVVLVLTIFIVVMVELSKDNSSGGDDDDGGNACFVTKSRPGSSNDSVFVTLADGTMTNVYSEALGSPCLSSYSTNQLYSKSNASIATPRTFTDGKQSQDVALLVNSSGLMVTNVRWSFDDGTRVMVKE